MQGLLAFAALMGALLCCRGLGYVGLYMLPYEQHWSLPLAFVLLTVAILLAITGFLLLV